MKVVILVVAAAICWAGAAFAEEVVCRGSISSMQGEGIVTKTYRFDVSAVAGGDLQMVLAKCKRIAQEKQAWMARKNPGGNFRSTSYVDMECVNGTERFLLRRSLQTRP